VTNTTTTTTTPTPRTVAERQAADGLAAIRAARANRRNAGATAPLAVVVPLAERFGAGATVAVVPRWRGAALCVHAPMRDGVPTPTRGVWIVTSTEYGYAAGTFRGPLAAAVKLARLWDAEFAAALDAAPIGAAGVPTLADWPQARAWSRQVTGDAPATGPVDANHGDYRRNTDARGDNGRRIGDGSKRNAPVVALDGDGGEQFPATATMTPSGPGRVRYARRLPDGRERLRHPETGKPVRMNGDCAAFKNPANPLEPVMRVWFGAAWFDVPSIAQCMEWSLDGVAETPDGSRVEPDATDSWLTLLGVI
jgi:hypothetical protein